MTEYSLEFIGRTVERMRADQITFREEVITRLDKIEKRQDHTDATLVRVIDVVTEIARVQETHSKLLTETKETCKIIESRIVRLEKSAGLLPA